MQKGSMKRQSRLSGEGHEKEDREPVSSMELVTRCRPQSEQSELEDTGTSIEGERVGTLAGESCGRGGRQIAAQRGPLTLRLAAFSLWANAVFHPKQRQLGA